MGLRQRGVVLRQHHGMVVEEMVAALAKAQTAEETAQMKPPHASLGEGDEAGAGARDIAYSRDRIRDFSTWYRPHSTFSSDRTRGSFACCHRCNACSSVRGRGARTNCHGDRVRGTCACPYSAYIGD